MHLHQKGFTLIELLVVIGIVGILLSITLVAINPARQFRLANDASRGAALNTLSSAVAQLIIDNKGALPTGFSVLSGATYHSMSTTNTVSQNGGSMGSAFMSLCQYLNGTASLNTVGAPTNQTYISRLPVDPTTGSFTSCTSFNTGFSMRMLSGRVWLTTNTQEPAATIEVSR